MPLSDQDWMMHHVRMIGAAKTPADFEYYKNLANKWAAKKKDEYWQSLQNAYAKKRAMFDRRNATARERNIVLRANAAAARERAAKAAAAARNAALNRLEKQAYARKIQRAYRQWAPARNNQGEIIENMLTAEPFPTGVATRLNGQTYDARKLRNMIMHLGPWSRRIPHSRRVFTNAEIAEIDAKGSRFRPRDPATPTARRPNANTPPPPPAPTRTRARRFLFG